MNTSLQVARTALTLDFNMFAAYAPGIRRATYLIARGTDLDHLRWQTPATPPAQHIEPEAQQTYCIAVKSIGFYSPGSTWTPFDDGAGAAYDINAGSASFQDGLIGSFDVSQGFGGTGDVRPFLGQYLGAALMPFPAENIVLTVQSSVDLRLAVQGHLDLEFWWSHAPPALLAQPLTPLPS